MKYYVMISWRSFYNFFLPSLELYIELFMRYLTYIFLGFSFYNCYATRHIFFLFFYRNVHCIGKNWNDIFTAMVSLCYTTMIVYIYGIVFFLLCKLSDLCYVVRKSICVGVKSMKTMWGGVWVILLFFMTKQWIQH